MTTEQALRNALGAAREALLTTNHLPDCDKMAPTCATCGVMRVVHKDRVKACSEYKYRGCTCGRDDALRSALSALALPETVVEVEYRVVYRFSFNGSAMVDRCVPCNTLQGCIEFIRLDMAGRHDYRIESHVVSIGPWLPYKEAESGK